MRFSEIKESSDASLYHFMDFNKAEAVFHDDAIRPSWKHDVPGLGEVYGTSMTRNHRLYVRNSRPVCIVVDRRTLKYTNKIVPLDGELVFSHTHKYRLVRDRTRYNTPSNIKHDFILAEEFVIGLIKPLNRYVTTISLNYVSHESVMQNWNAYLISKKYADRHGIPIIGGEAFINKFEERQKQWSDDED